MSKSSKPWKNTPAPRKRSADLSVSIRTARMSDLSALLALETNTFSADRLSERSLRRHLQSDTAKVLVAVSGESCLGYALLLFRGDSSAARLYSLAVDRKARGRGVGRALLSACEKQARQCSRTHMRLEVRADNKQARSLYISEGYGARDVVSDYYQDGMAAVKFEKPLRPRRVSMGRT